jgi:DNA-binding NtrC family response regulator
MLTYNWPGNVRQLRSVIRRAVLLSDGIITEEHLNLRKNGNAPSAENGLMGDPASDNGEWGNLPMREILRRNTIQIERKVIAHALRRTGGNKAKAARLLQVDYKTLHLKVKMYGIQIEGEQPHDRETQGKDN